MHKECRADRPANLIRPIRLYVIRMDLFIPANMYICAATWENVPFHMCAQRRFKSACAFAQSDQSLRCPHEETLHLGYLKYGQWRFWSDFANAQADLNLCWAHMSEGRTCPRVQFLTLSLIPYARPIRQYYRFAHFVYTYILKDHFHLYEKIFIHLKGDKCSLQLCMHRVLIKLNINVMWPQFAHHIRKTLLEVI